MKTKTNFSARMLDIFAAVMVTLFPTLCVKKFTKKSNKNAKKFLLGAEKELKAIEKLGLKNEALAERVWSEETRIELINKHNYVLVGDVASAEEIEALFQVRASSAILIKAFKVYTPSRQLLLRMLRSESYESVMLEVVAKFPSTLNWLDAREILGVKKDEPYKGESAWSFARVLIVQAPKTWAVPFMMEVHKISPRQRNDAALDIWEQGFEAAFKLKLDLSGLIVAMSVLNKEKYTRIVNHYDKYEDFSPYFEKMFPQLVKYLDKTSFDLLNGDVDDIVFEDSTEQRWKKEAFRWLQIGYFLMGNEKICEVILDNLGEIRNKVSSSVEERLEKRIAKRAYTPRNLSKAHKLLPSDYQEELLRSALASSNPFLIKEFFPFRSAQVSVAKQAVRFLIEKLAFPVESMKELTPELQQFAEEALEVNAQIVSLRDKFQALCENKAALGRLLPEAQKFFVERYPVSFKKFYNPFFKMDDETFKRLLKGSKGTLGFASDIILEYAKRWGISKELYLCLLQSCHKDCAVFIDKSRIDGQPLEPKDEAPVAEEVSKEQ